MAGDVLLDTNVVIALLKVEPKVVQRVAAATAI
jgi:predicted nucleic acid-binding protein